MKKRIFAFGFIAVFFAIAMAFVFRQPLFLAIVDWQARSYCKDCVGSPLQYQALLYQDDAIVLDHPEIFLTEDGSSRLSAERIVIRHDWSILQHRVDIDIDIANPLIEIKELSAELLQLLAHLRCSSFWINTHVKLTVNDGIILVPAHSYVQIAGKQQIPVHFNIAGECRDSLHVDLEGWLDKPDSPDNHFEVHINDQGPQLVVKSQIHQVQGSDAVPVLHVLFPDTKLWEVSEGVADGEMILTLSKKKIHPSGEIKFKQVAFNYIPIDFKGKIPEAVLRLGGNSEQPVHLALNEPITLTIGSEQDSMLMISNGTGWSAINESGIIDFSLKGDYEHGDKPAQVAIEGSICPECDAQCRLSFNNDEKEIASAHLKWFSQGPFTEGYLQHMGPHEYKLFQTLFKAYKPEFPETQLKKGTIDLSFHTNVADGIPSDLRLDYFKGENVELFCPVIHLNVSAKKFDGSLYISSFAPTFYDKADADIFLDHGSLTWTDQSWHWGDVSALINLNKGTLSRSQLHLRQGPLTGEINVNENKEMRLEVFGNLEDLAKAIPNAFQKGIHAQFGSEKLILKALGEQKEGRLLLKGILDLQGQNAVNAVSFGFDWDPITSSVYNGSFRTKNLPLEKFISPFIFPEGEATLAGQADIEGVFDSGLAIIRYTTRNIVADSPYFKIDIKGPQDANPLEARHEFNFVTGSHMGMIPIVDGSYHDKLRGMTFSNVKAYVTLQEKKVSIKELEAFANGIYLAGDMDVDYTGVNNGLLDLNVCLSSLNGKVTQLLQLAESYGKPLALAKLPLEGNISLIKDGCRIHLKMDPEVNQEGYVMQANIQGAMTDGAISFPESEVSIQDICCNVFYDHQKSILNIGDVQGSLIVGRPGNVEEYSIAGDGIHFSDYSRNEMAFDLWVGDRLRDILRVAGKTVPGLTVDPDSIAFRFDHALTHFGDVHPNHMGLVVGKDWSEVKNFQLQMGIRLNTLFRDLQRFSRTGLFFLSRSLLKELNDVKTAKGDINVGLSYDKQGGQIVYHLTGDDVEINRAVFKKITLNGKKHDSSWIIDQLQLDDLSFSADITRLVHDWKINFLGFRQGDALLLGMDGLYNSERNSLEADLNILEIDLAHLSEMPYLKRIAEHLPIKGELKGKGRIQADLFQNNEWVRADADLEFGLKGVEFYNLFLKDVDQVKAHFSTDRGLTIEKLNTALMPVANSRDMIVLGLDQASYDLINLEWQLKGVRFGIPAYSSDWLAHRLKPLLVGTSIEPYVDWLEKLKRDPSLDGILNLDFSPGHHSFSLVLRGGKYSWEGQEHELTDISINGNTREIQFATHYRMPQQYLSVYGKGNPITQEGELFIADKNSDEIHLTKPAPVAIKLQYLPSGLHVQSAEGFLSGLDIHLASKGPLSPLEGIVFVNLNLATPLMTPELVSMVHQLGLGDGYALRGYWDLGFLNGKGLSFQGLLEGKNFNFKEYRFANLQAEAIYNAGRVDIKNVQVADPAARVEIPEMIFWKEMINRPDAPWLFSFPVIYVHDFQPSLLRSDTIPASKDVQKPILIREIQINGVSGNAFDISTMSGSGDLHFTTIGRKNFPHPIFAIPSEVIGRLGLDLGALNPATGSVYFEIRGDKVYLTKLKDVYSEGKLSRFYLTKSPNSYFDLNGNLNIQVKMKQYNLLFKLAELFTLTIKGNFEKPVYSLQQQPLLHNDKSDIAED